MSRSSNVAFRPHRRGVPIPLLIASIARPAGRRRRGLSWPWVAALGNSGGGTPGAGRHDADRGRVVGSGRRGRRNVGRRCVALARSGRACQSTRGLRVCRQHGHLLPLDGRARGQAAAARGVAMDRADAVGRAGFAGGRIALSAAGREIHPARGWFLLILITLGTLNYLPTRFGLSSLLWAAGEVALLALTYPVRRCWVGRGRGSPWDCSWRPWRSPGCEVVAPPAKIPWIVCGADFRDSYGAVWAMRIAERVNTAAAEQGWGQRLDWSGFSQNQAGSPVFDPDSPDPLLEHFRSLLRRFVSNDWIDGRRSGNRGPTPPAANG